MNITDGKGALLFFQVGRDAPHITCRYSGNTQLQEENNFGFT